MSTEYGKMGAVDFMNLIEDTFNTMLKLSDTKGAEYASDKQNQNRHENFDRAAARMGLAPEQILQVYLDKHMTAIYTWISRVANPPKTEVVTSEPITGRIDDAILYLILLKGLYLRRLGMGVLGMGTLTPREEPTPERPRPMPADGSDC